MKFCKRDINILKQGLLELNDKELLLLRLRYFENLSIDEIAGLEDLSWDEVDQQILKCHAKLKDYCLSTSDFSLYFKPQISLSQIQGSVGQEVGAIC